MSESKNKTPQTQPPPEQIDNKKAIVSKEIDISVTAREKITELNGLISKLKDFYHYYQIDAIPKALKQYYEELGSVHKQLSEILNSMLNNPSSSNESLVSEIIQLNDEVSFLNSEYDKLVQGKTKWSVHKTTILTVLNAKTPQDLITDADPLEKLFKEARKRNAPMVHYNSSDLFNDGDSPDPRPPTDLEGKEIISRKAEFLAEEEKKDRDKKAMQLAALLNGDASSSEDSSLEIITTKKTNNDPVLVRKLYTESKEEKKVEVESVRTNQTGNVEIKEKVTRKLSEKVVENSIVEEEKQTKVPIMKEDLIKTKSESRREQIEMIKKEESHNESPTIKNQQERSNTNTTTAKPQGITKTESIAIQQAVSTNQTNTQKEIVEENKMTSNLKTSAKIEGGGTSIRSNKQKLQLDEPGDSKGMIQSSKFGSFTATNKYAADLKMMERSIRAVRERSIDVSNIKEGINQSLSSRNIQTPKYKDILDQNLLKNLEDQIEHLKKEQHQTTVEDQIPKKHEQELPPSVKIEPSETKRDPELAEQTLLLQKKCGEYQQEIEKTTKENLQLKAELQDAQSKLAILSAQSLSIEEIENIKQNNVVLINKVKLLEEQLKDMQNNSKKQHVTKNSMDMDHGQRQDSEEVEHFKQGNEFNRINGYSKSNNQAIYVSQKREGHSEHDANHKQVHNAFTKPNEIAVPSDKEDYLSDSQEARGSVKSENLVISSKHEHHDGKERLVHEILMNTPSRGHALPNFVSPRSQKSTMNNFQQKGTRSPQERFYSSSGLSNREDFQPFKSGSKFYTENNIESDIEQEVESIKGKQVPSEHYVLKELRPRLQVTENSFYQFKVSCLKAKSLLFENDFMQIGITTNIVQDYASSKNVLRLIVYYGNKLKGDIIRFKTVLTEGLNLNVMTKPELFEAVMPPNKQIKQQFLISFTSVPFNCLQLNCEGLFAETPIKFSVQLPNLLIKFMEFKYIELVDYKARWTSSEVVIVKTEPIAVNTGLISKVSDFKNYFGDLIDVGSLEESIATPRSNGIKLGGLFELDHLNVEYLLKINVLPTNEVVFQIAAQPRYQTLATYLLQTMIFIFRR